MGVDLGIVGNWIQPVQLDVNQFPSVGTASLIVSNNNNNPSNQSKPKHSTETK